MRINESANLNKYIMCWPSLLDEAVYPDLIYLAIHSSAVKWDKQSPFTLFTRWSQLWRARPRLRICQHFHYKSLFFSSCMDPLPSPGRPSQGAQTLERHVTSIRLIIHHLCCWVTRKNMSDPHPAGWFCRRGQACSPLHLFWFCRRGQACSPLHLFWFFSHGPFRDRLGPKCAVSISILLGMGRPIQFSELLSSLGRSLSRRPWGAEIIGDRPAIGLTGGPAQEAGGRSLLLWVFQ